MADFKIDPIGDLMKAWKETAGARKIGLKIGRSWKANRMRPAIEAEYGSKVADAISNAIRRGQDPSPILERAQKDKEREAEREALLAAPPALHGSGAWAKEADLAPFLRDRRAFDNPSSIILGAFGGDDGTTPPEFLHWDDQGHLLTVAPTRSGKAVTTIIPNLLRYRGSAIVIDPKGELYDATSKWRGEHVGPVYRLAPFDDGSNPATASYPRHGFNPLTRIRVQSDARALAELMFPRDPRSPEFFSEDAVAFVTAVILFVLDRAPPEKHNLAIVRKLVSQPVSAFKNLAREMASSPLAAVAEAAENLLGKSSTGLSNLRDTLHTKLALWSDAAIQDNGRRHDFNFEALKEQPATVYLQIPFDLMAPYGPWLRVILKSALDAMTRNPAMPAVPVLFVLDEFLALGPFPEFKNAIRTHAGSGVRLWFFLQDMGSLEEMYPNNAWRPFLNCSVKQFFGVDDPFTGELVGKYLGTATVAFRALSSGGNLSAQAGGGSWNQDGGSTSVSFQDGETIQFVGRPLLTPDEVMALLSPWRGDGWRWGIVQLRGPRPAKIVLTSWNTSEICRQRFGAYRHGETR